MNTKQFGSENPYSYMAVHPGHGHHEINIIFEFEYVVVFIIHVPTDFC